MQKTKNNIFLNVNTPTKTLRMQSFPSQSAISQTNLLQQQINDNDLVPNERLSREKGLSIQRSRNSQILQSTKIEIAKQVIRKTLTDLLQQLNKRTNKNQKIQIVKITNELKKYTDFQDYFHNFLSIYNKYYRLLLYDNQASLPVDLKLKKRIFFTKQSPQKYSRKGQLEQAIKENQHLKKDISRLKQTVASLQKRILTVVTQYKQRKQIYLLQIQKLTNIINCSIKEIPQIVLKNKKRLQQSSRKDILEPPQIQRLSFNKKQSDYHTLQSFNNPRNVAIENNFRTSSMQKKGILPRYKSQQQLRTYQ